MQRLMCYGRLGGIIEHGADVCTGLSGALNKCYRRIGLMWRQKIYAMQKWKKNKIRLIIVQGGDAFCVGATPAWSIVLGLPCKLERRVRRKPGRHVYDDDNG